MNAHPEDRGKPGQVCLLIPTLNEEEALPHALEALERARSSGVRIDEVLVADNGSTDRTVEIAERWGATVVREPERGYGAACLAGIRLLSERERPPEILAFLDADLSEDPDELDRLTSPLLRNDAEMVLGVRRSGASDSGGVPIHARLGNALVLGLVRVLFGYRFSDLPPFRAVRFDRLRSLGMDDRNWGWTLQMQIRARRAGWRIVEIPVRHRAREVGSSKISGSLIGSIKAGSKMLWTAVRERFRSGG